MLIEVRQPYVDVSAHDLSLTLGATAAPALETLRATIGGLEIELRLLGCSHQALVDGGAVLSETVACVPGVAGSLPQRRTDGGYDFRARVERLAPEAYATRAAELLARAAADPHALAGVFAAAPGADGSQLPAFTALAAHALAPPASASAAAHAPAPPASAVAHALASCASASVAGIAWTTWHGYPQTGEIVVTASSLERAR